MAISTMTASDLIAIACTRHGHGEAAIFVASHPVRDGFFVSRRRATLPSRHT